MMREFFTRNLGLKIVSVVLAISLELYFMSPTNQTVQTLRVPVDLINVPAEMVTTSPSMGEEGLSAEVKIRGPAPLVDYAKGNPYRFVARVPDFTGNQQNFAIPLAIDQLGLPRGIVVMDLSPRVVDLKLERMIRKEVPVEVQREGVVAMGYEITSLRAVPEKLAIWGPESEIGVIDRVLTEPVHLDELRGERVIEAPIIELGPFSNYEQDSVRVTVRAEPKLAERTLDGIRVQIRAPQGVASTIEPSKAKVTISARESTIGKIADREIVLFADLSGFQEGTHEIQVNADLPDGVRMLKVVPEKVRVTILTGKEQKN